MSYIDAIKSAIKFICGDEKKVCRLCFGTTKSDEVSIHDLLCIDTPYYKDSITCLSIFQQLGVSIDPALPEVLCLNCATLTVNSILLQKLCEYSEQQWLTSLCLFSKTIAQSVSLSTKVVSAFFIVKEDDSSMMASYNPMPEKNRQNILAILQKNMSIQLKSLKNNNQIKNKFPCPSCPKIFLKAYELEDHKEQVHYPRKLECDLCTKMFSTEKQLLRHKNLHHIRFTCKLCNLELSSKCSFRLHMDKHRQNCCPRCNKQFAYQISYRKHLKLCGQKFICDLCHKVFNRKQNLIFHLKCTHVLGKNLLPCQWCGKKYGTKRSLNLHIVKHTRERKFTCEICGGKFVTNTALIYHLRRHTGERPYPCDMCDERFVSASTRLAHKNRVHFGPTKECNICQAKFVTNYDLKNHKRWHDNPRSKLYVAKINSVSQNDEKK